MRRTVVGLILVMLTLSGCATTVAGSGEPPTGRWTLPEAQQHYLAYVSHGNQDIEIVNRLICTCVTQLDPHQLANACTTVAGDDLTLAQNLEAGQWPETAVSAIDSLAGAVKSQAKGYQSCGAATSVASMRSHEAGASKTTAQATAVREALGLPPVGPPQMAPSSVVSSPPGAY
jgi:hypothetical protein